MFYIKKTCRIGKSQIQKCGEIATIIEYNNNQDIKIKFNDTNEIVNCQYEKFRSGNVKSHFKPSVFGVGILGLENAYDSNGIVTKSYLTWKNMIQRCYSDKFKQNRCSYAECSVCNEWHYYSNFKKWYDENYYEIENQRMCLDKDILIKGNKVYSPETCVFVPHIINTLFLTQKKARGEFPIGVSLDKRRNKYTSVCNTLNGRKNLGYHNDVYSAFNSYKLFKESYIKIVAEQYKMIIPNKLYNAMINYIVEFTD